MTYRITPEEIESALNKSKGTDKMVSIDYQKIAKRNKKTVEEIKPIVDTFLEELKTEIPDATEEEYIKLVYRYVDKKIYVPPEKKSSLEYAKEKAQKYNVVLFSVSGVEDANDGKKSSVKREYRNYITEKFGDKPNPKYDLDKAKKMITDGKIEVIKNSDGSSSWHVLDTVKEFKTGPNKNFGKPLDYVRERTIFGIDLSDNTFCKIHGAVGIDEKVNNPDGTKTVKKAESYPDIGVKCSIWGTKTPNQPGKDYVYDAVIKVWKDAYEDSTVSNDISYKGSVKDLWNMVEAFHDQFFISQYNGVDENGTKVYENKKAPSITDVMDMPSWGMFVTRGYIGEITPSETSNSTRISVRNDTGDTIRLSTSYGPVLSKLDDLAIDDEVIVIGERKSFKSPDGQFRTYNALYGVFKNPNGHADVSDAEKRYEELMKSRS